MDKKTSKLLNRIESLERENRNIRKKMSQYKRLVSKSANILLANFENKKDEDVVVHKDDKLCDDCGRGYIKKVKILDLTFEICQFCGTKNKKK